MIRYIGTGIDQHCNIFSYKFFEKCKDILKVNSKKDLMKFYLQRIYKRMKQKMGINSIAVILSLAMSINFMHRYTLSRKPIYGKNRFSMGLSIYKYHIIPHNKLFRFTKNHINDARFCKIYHIPYDFYIRDYYD